MNLHAATRSDAIAALGQRFGDALVTSAPIRAQHANTTTWIAAQPPDAVLFPHSAEEVQEAVRICAAHSPGQPVRRAAAPKPLRPPV
jgi:FAD/FMN-containing dehydrogenase